MFQWIIHLNSIEYCSKNQVQIQSKWKEIVFSFSFFRSVFLFSLDLKYILPKTNPLRVGSKIKKKNRISLKIKEEKKTHARKLKFIEKDTKVERQKARKK